MPFARPPLTDIISRVLADLSSRFLGIDGAVLRRSVLGTIGRALAGAAHELHGRLDFLARQIIIDTAEAEFLIRWAAVWKVSRKPAEYATGPITITGSNGSTIPTGAILKRQDGALFETKAEVVIAGGTASVNVEALEAGAAGNTASAVTLTFEQPIAGVQTQAAVAAGGLSAGSDTEDDDSLRARLLSRIRKPPQGGASYDYVTWALEVPGVTRAWVYPREMGLGTVTVRFVRDDDASIIPDSTEIAAVYDYIEYRRPVTAELFVVAPIPVALNFDIDLNPNTSVVRAAVEAELLDMIRREAEPGGTILISRIREAVSTAAGEADNVVVSPSANVTRSAGEITIPGAFTFGPIA